MAKRARPVRANPSRGVELFRRAYRSKDGERRHCSTWTARVWVGGAMHERALGVRDRRAAELIASDWVRSLELRMAGLELHDDTRSSPIEELIGEYSEELRRRRRDARYVDLQAERIRSMLQGVRALTEVTPALVRRRLGELTRERSLSARTSNYYRGALGTFFRWLVREERWHRNPVQAVGAARAGDPARERRALTMEEVRALLAVAPRDRRACYMTAVLTGLRRSELARLTWAEVDLDAGVLRLKAWATKARRRSGQEIPEALVEELRQLRADRAAGKVERRGPRPKNAAGWRPRDQVLNVPTLRPYLADLAEAGIERDTPTGRADFHSLRVTYNTALKDLGVGLGVRQALMRHSTPDLTSGPYETRWDAERRAAVDQLGEALGAVPVAVSTRAPQERELSAKRKPETVSGKRVTKPQPDSKRGRAGAGKKQARGRKRA